MFGISLRPKPATAAHVHTVPQDGWDFGRATSMEATCTSCGALLVYFGPAYGIYVPSQNKWLDKADWHYV